MYNVIVNLQINKLQLAALTSGGSKGVCICRKSQGVTDSENLYDKHV